MPDPNKKSSSLMRVAVGGSAVLVIAGLGAFWYASNKAKQAAPQDDANTVTVTIQDNVCKPNDITVPAGRTTFRIVNNSDRALEWEILDGIMVVEERENIAPGFTQTMKVKLRPGDYDITCGLLSNPRGKLHVTPSAESEAEGNNPSALNFLGAQAEYKFYLISQSSQLADAVGELQAAIQAGQLQQAQALYAPAHLLYKRVEPMAENFADLETRINGRADYFAKREADPEFRGFHRLEYGLFGQGQGDLKALQPVANTLAADVDTLKTRLAALETQPERLASSAARLLRRTADNLPNGGEEGWSHAEAADLQGTLDGTKKLANLVLPMLTKPAPDLKKSIEDGFAQFAKELEPYRDGDGFKPGALPADARQAITATVSKLADDLAKVNAALKLE